ncbi:MAG: ribbon-helix-helix protein, CopG family [Chloroflexi bacterium]|nr:ribbon-helix-helix protein, CopG family [Chloroflexota bacterium]
MKKHNKQVPTTEEGFALRFHHRAKTRVSIQIPDDSLASLQKVAASRDMSIEALIKLYVGQGLRQDLAKLSADRVLEKTALPSQE